jgi:hypothetical protein
MHKQGTRGWTDLIQVLWQLAWGVHRPRMHRYWEHRNLNLLRLQQSVCIILCWQVEMESVWQTQSPFNDSDPGKSSLENEHAQRNSQNLICSTSVLSSNVQTHVKKPTNAKYILLYSTFYQHVAIAFVITIIREALCDYYKYIKLPNYISGTSQC